MKQLNSSRIPTEADEFIYAPIKYMGQASEQALYYYSSWQTSYYYSKNKWTWLLHISNGYNGGPFRVSKIAIKTVRLPFIPTLLYCIY